MDPLTDREKVYDKFYISNFDWNIQTKSINLSTVNQKIK